MGRYEVLSRTNQEAYLKNCPLLMVSMGLTYDREKDAVLAQLKFQNLSRQIVKAVYVKIECRGAAGEALDEAVEFAYLDLCVQPDQFFGGDIPIYLPDKKTRDIIFRCTQIAFVNDTVWSSKEDVYYNPLPRKQSLQSCLDEELYGELMCEAAEERILCEDVYFPYEVENIRLCPCGTYNLKGDTVCRHCQKDVEWWYLHISKENLRESVEQRREKEKELQEEQKRIESLKQAEKAERIKKVKKTALRIGITAGILCILVAAYMLVSRVILPSHNYKKGLALIEQEEYEEAKSCLEKSGDYKDSKTQYDKAEALLQAKTDYGMGLQKFEAELYYDAARAFGKAQIYKDGSDRYREALYQGIRKDISDKTLSGTTLEALEVLEAGGVYKGTAYYFGKYYYLNGQYKEALEKWDLKDIITYPDLEKLMKDAENQVLYQEASELAGNLELEEAYEKLQAMDAEVQDSEQMKTAVSQALESGFLGMWRQIDTSAEIFNENLDSFMLIKAAYRDGELKYYFAEKSFDKGKKPDKLKIEEKTVEENKRYFTLQGDILQEISHYSPKNTIKKEDSYIRRETERTEISGTGSPESSNIIEGHYFLYERYE